MSLVKTEPIRGPADPIPAAAQKAADPTGSGPTTTAPDTAWISSGLRPGPIDPAEHLTRLLRSARPLGADVPAALGDRQRAYLQPGSRAFVRQYARYAPDFVTARVQGLRAEDPFGWDTARVRLSEAMWQSAGVMRDQDDYKLVLFEDPAVTYVRPGAKLETMGNTWLVTRPRNLSVAAGVCLVRRCTAAWNYLDWYGNVQHEPMIVSDTVSSVGIVSGTVINLASGSWAAVCQYNPQTACLDRNTRMILGSGAYRVGRLQDFLTEFSDEPDSIRLLGFSLEYEEPNGAIDDMTRRVAGGRSFCWTLELEPGTLTLPDGAVGEVRVRSLRCGREAAAGTAEHPIDWIWTTTDSAVAIAEPLPGGVGRVTALGTGSCLLRCELAQNPEVHAEAAVLVQ